MPFFVGSGIYKAIATNTVGGTGALIRNITGTDNMALGASALGNIVDGSSNIAIGNFAGNAAINASSNNLLIGQRVAQLSLTLNSSVLMGSLLFSASSPTIGFSVVVGAGALTGAAATSVLNSVVVGAGALLNPTTLSSMVAIGHEVAKNATGTPSNSVLIGKGAALNTTGTNNVVVGSTAAPVIGSANACTVLGASAAVTMTGGNNTFLGFDAGSFSTSGANNVSVGSSAAVGSTGNDNVAIGANVNGAVGASAFSFCVIIGASASNTSGLSNNVIIGRLALIGGSGTNSIAIGTSASTNKSSVWVMGGLGSVHAIQEGVNAAMGISTLVAGTIAISTTIVTATSRIFYSVKTAGGTQGFLSYVITPGVGFTVTSTSVLDTSIIVWEIKEPA